MDHFEAPLFEEHMANLARSENSDLPPSDSRKCGYCTKNGFEITAAFFGAFVGFVDHSGFKVNDDCTVALEIQWIL